MSAARVAIVLAAGLALLAPERAVPAERGATNSTETCLTRTERRAARAAGRAIRLSELRDRHNIKRSDIIDARLCESPEGLLFRLTLLARDGKVSRVTYDAVTGAVVRGP